MNMIEIGSLAGLTVVKWLVYTALLWGMIKAQKMQYNVLGLFGSSLLAILLNFLPIVGCYLSWAVLVLCLWKVTRSDIVPDVLFTVGVAGAIMFCLNLWAFAALMGDLRPSLAGGSTDTPPSLEEVVDNDDPTPAPAPADTPRTPAPQKSAAQNARGSGTPTAVPTNQAVATRPALPVTDGSAHGLALKGVVLQASQPSAMIMASNKYYTIETGDVLSIPTAQGKLKLRCNSIQRSSVSLTLNDAQEVILRVR